MGRKIYCFKGSKDISEVTIPKNVTELGDFALSMCKSLTSVTIPNMVTKIGSHAFEKCT